MATSLQRKMGGTAIVSHVNGEENLVKKREQCTGMVWALMSSSFDEDLKIYEDQTCELARCDR